MDKQKMLIGGAVLLSVVILLIIIGRTMMKPKTGGSSIQSPTEAIDQPIPTIDDTVRVALTSQAGSHDVVLSINEIPQGTESIDYELSYQTVKQGLQGVIGTIAVTESNFEKKLTLGTCSSGACVYHEVDGAVKVNLKFMGSFGDKVFEKEYTL